MRAIVEDCDSSRFPNPAHNTVWYARKKCISGEKSDIVHSNHNYDGRQITAKWNNEEFGYFNTITKIAKAILWYLGTLIQLRAIK